MRRIQDIRYSLKKLQLRIEERRKKVIERYNQVYLKRFGFVPDWDWGWEIINDFQISQLYEMVERQLVQVRRCE